MFIIDPGQIFFYSKSIFNGAKIPEDSVPFAVIGTNAVNVAMTFVAVMFVPCYVTGS